MQASGLEGPLPSSLSALNNMRDLWVLASKLSAILINIISLMCFSNLIKKIYYEDTCLLMHYHDVTFYRRISDLSGESSDFPNLSNMTGMQKLWAIFVVLVYFWLA